MTEYGASSIQVLKGLEAVRQRPAMYIGDTSIKGLHHLIWETIDNSIDEVMAGHGDEITVINHPDNSISVIDCGRGIPVDIHPVEGVPALQVVLTKLHAGGKFDEKVYGASGGLHGVGVSCVNALSSKLKATVWRNNLEYNQTYEKGAPITELDISKPTRKNTGTKIQFWPDETIFESVEFDEKIITSRLQELSYLNPRLALKFINSKGKKTVFESKNGLVDYVDAISRDKEIQPGAIDLNGSDAGIKCFIAMRWTKSSNELIKSYCNNIVTPEGGTHVTGFKMALTRAALKFLANYIPKSLEQPSPDDIREGLRAVISVRVPQPQFEGQTKAKLGTSMAQTVTNAVVYQGLTDCFENMKKDQLKLIAERIINATKARLAAQRARDNARKAANLSTDSLPGKLTDCQNENPEDSEIFIVEGDSAGGSAKQGRNRKFQAILPLKGKILNCEKASMKSVFKNNEIQLISAALGLAIGTASIDLTRLRYHKVIIMTDADVDGSHIRTLLLTLFFRHMPELILNGNLYIAQPPIYRVKAAGKKEWIYEEADLQPLLKTLKAAGHKTVISRFKGLGEMSPDMLWETTMDPSKRRMKRVSIDDYECDMMFTTLMGDDVDPRAEFIMTNSLSFAK